MLTIITACSTIKVSNINESTNVKNYDFIYNLPLTSFDVKLELTKETYIAGPYAKYAKTYLGINNITTKESNNWTITDIDIESVEKIDTANYYVVQSKGVINSFALSKNGLLESINAKPRQSDTVTYDKFILSQTSKNLNYHYGIVKSPLKERVDTTYKVVTTDSTSRRVPVYSKKIVNKSTKDRAEEASKFIIKVRKRKFRVLTGLDKDFPDGKAINKIIKELDKLEKEYLSLFIGETIYQKYYYKFNITPRKNKSEYTICSISETQGIVPANKGSKLILKIDNSKNVNKITEFLSANTEGLAEQKGLAYRQSEKVLVSIIKGNLVFYKNQMYIPQFGEVLFLNKNQIKDRSIRFDLKTGAINCVN